MSDKTTDDLIRGIAEAMHTHTQEYRPITDWADMSAEYQDQAMDVVTAGMATPEGRELARRMAAATEEDAVADEAANATCVKIANIDRIIGLVICRLGSVTNPEECSHMARSLRDLEEAKAIAAGNCGV